MRATFDFVGDDVDQAHVTAQLLTQNADRTRHATHGNTTAHHSTHEVTRSAGHE